MEDEIKKLIFDAGADVCGIANIDRFSEAPEGFRPTDTFEKCKSVVSFGVALPKGLAEISPRLVYGHYNAFAETKLDDIALKCARIIEQRFNAEAVPMPSDSPYEYWDAKTKTGKGLISMKHTAYLAGLGDIGKNTLLINPQYGNMLVLGAILLDLDLKSDEMCEKLCLPSCHKCIDNCSVGAIQNGSVNQLKCRTNTYKNNARGFDTVECNKCRAGCPLRFGVKR